MLHICAVRRIFSKNSAIWFIAIMNAVPLTLVLVMCSCAPVKGKSWEEYRAQWTGWCLATGEDNIPEKAVNGLTLCQFTCSKSQWIIHTIPGHGFCQTEAAFQAYWTRKACLKTIVWCSV